MVEVLARMEYNGVKIDTPALAALSPADGRSADKFKRPDI